MSDDLSPREETAADTLERRVARLETLAQWWLEGDPEAPEAAKAAWADDEPQQTPAERRTGQKLLDMVRPGWRERLADRLESLTRYASTEDATDLRHAAHTIRGDGDTIAALRSVPAEPVAGEVEADLVSELRATAAVPIPADLDATVRHLLAVIQRLMGQAADRMEALAGEVAMHRARSDAWQKEAEGLRALHLRDVEAAADKRCEGLRIERDRLREERNNAAHAALTAAGVPNGTLVERIEQLIEGWEDAEVERDTEVMDNDRLRRLLAQRAPSPVALRRAVAHVVVARHDHRFEWEHAAPILPDGTHLLYLAAPLPAGPTSMAERKLRETPTGDASQSRVGSAGGTPLPAPEPSEPGMIFVGSGVARCPKCGTQYAGTTTGYVVDRCICGERLKAPEPSEPTHTDLIARWQEREQPASAPPLPGGTEGEP